MDQSKSNLIRWYTYKRSDSLQCKCPSQVIIYLLYVKTAVELIFLNNTVENIRERLKYKRKRRKLYSKVCHRINFLYLSLKYTIIVI